MRPLAALPDAIFTDAEALAVFEAAIAWGGAPFEDALTHAVLNDPARGERALAALRTAGVLDRAGRPGEWLEAGQSLLARDPEAPALLERLCRYEGIVIQGYTLASGQVLHAGLAPRIAGDHALLARAVAEGVGLPAADLAAAMLAGLVLVGRAEDAPVLLALAEQEAAVARQGPDPARLDLALSNLSTVREMTGDAAGALGALRARLAPAPDLDDALRIATLALRAAELDLAGPALERAWALSAAGDSRRPAIAQALAQVRLANGDAAGARRLAAEGRAAGGDALAIDFDLADALALGAADGIHAALSRALAAGPPIQGRILDLIVRLVRLRRVPPAVLVALVGLAEKERVDAAPPLRVRWDGWVVILGFLVAWTHVPDDARLGVLARRADDVSGGAFRFVTWDGLAEA